MVVPLKLINKNNKVRIKAFISCDALLAYIRKAAGKKIHFKAKSIGSLKILSGSGRFQSKRHSPSLAGRRASDGGNCDSLKMM